MDAVPARVTAQSPPAGFSAAPPSAAGFSTAQSSNAQSSNALPSWPPPTRARTPRIHGIDLARGLAMLGMVIVHYVWASNDTGLGAEVATAMEGRAMPLFMLLGGVGVVLLSSRSSNPDRGLVIRAVILLAIGLFLDAVNDRIAVVLQFYGLLFLVSPLLRRLSSPILLGAAALSVAVGGVTFQTVGQPRQRSSFEAIGEGWPFLRSLIFDGYYPFFPVFAFFGLGMVLARLDLRDRKVAVALAAVGTAVGFGALLVADILADALAVDPEAAVAPGTFSGAALLDTTGHSAMPAWVISAAGTSVAVLGLSLLAARAAPTLTRPIATLGTVALSFYVFQVLTTLIITSPNETTLGREWLNVAMLYGGFMLAAMVWKHWFRSGPLEAFLRVGTPRRN